MFSWQWYIFAGPSGHAIELICHVHKPQTPITSVFMTTVITMNWVSVKLFYLFINWKNSVPVSLWEYLKKSATITEDSVYEYKFLYCHLQADMPSVWQPCACSCLFFTPEGRLQQILMQFNFHLLTIQPSWVKFQNNGCHGRQWWGSKRLGIRAP